MTSWKTYAKAARNTARKQAPGAKDALRREYTNARREAEIHARAASRVWDEQGREYVARGSERARERADNTRRTMEAAARVAGRRYKQAHVTSRILGALKDTSIIALSVGALWFVFSRIVPIPVTWALVFLAVLVCLRVLWAITHNPWQETDDDDPEGVPASRLPEGAELKKRRRGKRERG